MFPAACNRTQRDPGSPLRCGRDGGNGERLYQLTNQVGPGRILLLNQLDLPLAPPSLQALLAGDRLADVIEGFAIHEPVDAISLGEAVGFAAVVLLKAPVEIARHAGVKRAVGPASEDVYDGGL